MFFLNKHCLLAFETEKSEESTGKHKLEQDKK